MDIPKRLESLHGLILSYISWEILYVCMQQSKRTPKVIKPLSAFIFLRSQRQVLFFYLNLQKIALKLLALIAPRKETQIHIEVRQIWPVLYWSNCGQNFLRNKKLCRILKKRPFFKGFKPQKRSVFGRSDRTRTCSILVPNQARYQLRYTSMVKNLWNCSSHRTGQNCGQTTFTGVGQTANARFSSVFLAFPRFFEEGIR